VMKTHTDGKKLGGGAGPAQLPGEAEKRRAVGGKKSTGREIQVVGGCVQREGFIDGQREERSPGLQKAIKFDIKGGSQRKTKGGELAKAGKRAP